MQVEVILWTLRSTYRKNKTQEKSHLLRGQERLHKEGNPKTEPQTADGYLPGSLQHQKSEKQVEEERFLVLSI